MVLPVLSCLLASNSPSHPASHAGQQSVCSLPGGQSQGSHKHPGLWDRGPQPSPISALVLVTSAAARGWGTQPGRPSKTLSVGWAGLAGGEGEAGQGSGHSFCPGCLRHGYTCPQKRVLESTGREFFISVKYLSCDELPVPGRVYFPSKINLFSC